MGFFKSLMSVISTDGKTGTPFNLDKKHTVYYKGNGVSELDAAHTAGFLQGCGYFNDTNEIDVQLFSESVAGTVRLGFFVNSPSISSAAEEAFKTMGNGLQKFFPNRSITVSLLDVNFKELKNLGSVNTTTY